ncbi:MAG TPA: hypothetical protein VFV85_07185, partial [Conexibacter sp.]|nr:hypothetical protein [Conexibacter sp.]
MRTPIRLALALAAALTLGLAATATAATITMQPAAGDARTFATSQGGWTSSVDTGGVCVIPGVTCPVATAAYQSAGGSGGASDGDVRASVQTVASLASNVTLTWSSPSFTAPVQTDQATLAVSVRPQVASLLGIGATVRLDAVLSDLDVPASSTAVARVPITTSSSSFAPLQLTVPPGALTPGHRYAIQLSTFVNAPLAISVSGSVDLDDVSLTMADLHPPSGLSASVPGSGATRVEGQVDPQGQATSVTVQYGPTSAYGSSTAPTGVSGSGSQPFAVPLAGLTAGATYHYRVVAANADGTAATNDAAFVAPTPPSDAPPLVTGAGNSRARTVVYDRGPDVASASVELLDGLGTVLSTTPDLDADGQVTVTLPDADGSYGVRVQRTNAASLTTPSGVVTTTLDRVPPSTAGLGLTVLPALSSDRQRAVRFTPPADAVAATAQVLDAADAPVGAPVAAAGGLATVQLGASDGDYRVAITL